ncbi:MAG: hypothetical protein HY954_00975 [Deltaproteobacteria bacterium]|nr:hypothetical protein [Deltaproteobacteria bacterium]
MPSFIKFRMWTGGKEGRRYGIAMSAPKIKNGGMMTNGLNRKDLLQEIKTGIKNTPKDAYKIQAGIATLPEAMIPDMSAKRTGKRGRILGFLMPCLK